MQKRFSCPDFSRKPKTEKKIEPPQPVRNELSGIQAPLHPPTISTNSGPVWIEHQRVEQPPQPPLVEKHKPVVKPKPKPQQPATTVTVVHRDPERDLFTFAPEPVKPPTVMSDELKQADALLAKGRELLRSWGALRSQKGDDARKTIIDARSTIEKAIENYRAAEKTSPSDAYIKAQLEAANQLHYVAIKSSPM